MMLFSSFMASKNIPGQRPLVFTDGFSHRFPKSLYTSEVPHPY